MIDRLPIELLRSLLPTLVPEIEILQSKLSLNVPRQMFLHAPFSHSITRLVLRSLLHGHASPSVLPRAAFVDCLLSYTPKIMFDDILNQLAGWTPVWNDQVQGSQNWDGRLDGYTTVRREDRTELEWDHSLFKDRQDLKGALSMHADDSTSTFVEALKTLYKLESPQAQSVPKFIVIFNADLLIPPAQGNPNYSGLTNENNSTVGFLFACLTRIGELTGKPIVPIFVSGLEPYKYQPPLGRAPQPASTEILFLPSLQKEDICQFFTHFWELNAKSDEIATAISSNDYRNYVDLIYEFFWSYLSSEDGVEELYRLCTGKMWTEYLHLVTEEQVSVTNLGRIRNLLESFREQEVEYIGHLPTMPHVKHIDRLASLRKATRLNLSTCAAFLLMAAYLASYNPARTDVRMFAVRAEENLNKAKSPRKKKQKLLSRKSDATRLIGPKAFPFERLMAIFTCILPEDLKVLADSDRSLTEVANLVASRLLIRTSKGSEETSIDYYSNLKLRVNVEFNVIHQLADLQRFKITDFLWEQE